MDETPRSIAHRLVHHRYGETLHILVEIYAAENERIEKRGNEKDENHHLVVKHTLHLNQQHIQYVDKHLFHSLTIK